MILILPLQPAGHIVTGNLKIISDSRIRNIVSKGPKYRFPSYINFDKCREKIASALNEFGNRWCKGEGVEDGALKVWKRSILTFVDKRIKFYSQNTNLLPQYVNLLRNQCTTIGCRSCVNSVYTYSCITSCRLLHVCQSVSHLEIKNYT